MQWMKFETRKLKIVNDCILINKAISVILPKWKTSLLFAVLKKIRQQIRMYHFVAENRPDSELLSEICMTRVRRERVDSHPPPPNDNETKEKEYKQTKIARTLKYRF